MISLDEALSAYARELTPLPSERRPLLQSLHGVLREPARAACDLPRHSQSAVDGYVLTDRDARAAPSRLRITGSIAAGDTGALAPLAAGETRRILTGGRVPPNAGAVVAQERVGVDEGCIQVSEPLPSGANIRWRGEEQKAGAELAPAGTRLHAGLIGSLAAGGVADICVTRKPRIAVLVGGDELRPLGAALADGQIWDSNGPLIATWLAERGIPAAARRIPDERDMVRTALAEALETSDVVVTTGGVSVGDRDYVIPCAEELGVRRVFWQVAQKPGKPIYFGLLGGKVLLGLPGNPGAVLIGLVLHLRGVLDRLEGAQPAGAPLFSGRLATPVPADSRRERLVRMRLAFDETGTAQLQPLPHQDSHMLSNLDRAAVLARLPARAADYAAGEVLQWTPLHGMRA